MAIAVNVGSKDERDESSGLVHLLEHCILFRGTESRSGSEISRDIRRHGAYFNAHTGHDLSLFEISLPSEYADFALENQKDILFHLEIAQDELDAEKSVILEELNDLENDPERFGLDLMFRALYKGHPYGRSVYGSRDVIEAATSDQLKAFHRAYFVPSNCALAAVGDFRIEEMEHRIRAVFGPLKKGDLTPPEFPLQPILKKKEEIRLERDIQQGYLFIGFIAPAYNHPDQFAMEVLTEIMGRGIYPLLSTALRRRRNLVQRCHMAYFANLFGGSAIVTMSMDPKNIRIAAREASSYLNRSHKENFSKDDFYGEEQIFAFDLLRSAKNQIRFSVQKGQESGLNLAASFARYMFLSDRPGEVKYLEQIDGLRSPDLRKVASSYFAKGEPVIISLVPKKEREKN
jgi:predicted Zn-dependent peptidase